MRKAKIIATLGPASASEEVLTKMIKAGMNIARLNFSHGSYIGHRQLIETYRAVRDKLDVPGAVMLDTKGPEIRIKDIEGYKVKLESGETFTLTSRDILGNANEVSITFPELLNHDIKIGQNIKIDDGNIDMTVTEITDTDIICHINDGGILSSHKGINVPKLHLNVPFLSENDKNDLKFGIEMGVDYVAASFVRCAQDVIDLRNFLDYNGGDEIKIISKIENIEGVENFDEILEQSDGIMVARGDMGVEIEFDLLPGIQKRCIEKCNKVGKPVITATQMLDSMIHNFMPTRAEITDVANAVFDGTSAVMLSGETTVGDYPVRVVEVMANIVEQAERDMASLGKTRVAPTDYKSDVREAICDAACITAKDLNAAAIIVVSDLGRSALECAKFHPDAPIVCATPNKKTYNQLALINGVYPVMALRQQQHDDEKLMKHAMACARVKGYVKYGDRVVITGGSPKSSTGCTNTLKVEVI